MVSLLWAAAIFSSLTGLVTPTTAIGLLDNASAFRLVLPVGLRLICRHSFGNNGKVKRIKNYAGIIGNYAGIIRQI